jgi:hypothetical protein
MTTTATRVWQLLAIVLIGMASAGNLSAGELRQRIDEVL